MFLLIQNKNIDEQMLLNVLKRCRLFLIEICIEIKLRFDFSDQILSSLITISPKHIFSQQHSNTLLNFIILFPRICNDEIHMQVIDDEWRKLNSYFYLDMINMLKNKNVDMFWLDLYLYEENGEKLFPNLSEFVFNILSLPKLNCVCERLFFNSLFFAFLAGHHIFRYNFFLYDNFLWNTIILKTLYDCHSSQTWQHYSAVLSQSLMSCNITIGVASGSIELMSPFSLNKANCSLSNKRRTKFIDHLWSDC